MRARPLVILTVACLALSAACGGSGSGDSMKSPVKGLLTDVHTSVTGELQTVMLQDDKDRKLDFTVDFAAGREVAASHLREHVRLKLPVLIYFAKTGGTLYASEIDDAPP